MIMQLPFHRERIESVVQPEEVCKLRDLKTETATPEQIKDSCVNATWFEIEEKIVSVSKYVHNLPQASPDETDDDRALRRRALNEKITLLRQCQVENENLRKAQRAIAEAKFSEQWFQENKPNIRYAYGSDVSLLRREGLNAAQVVDWKTPLEPIVDVPCLSGKIVKMDLRRLPAQLCRNMSQHKFSPIFLTAEQAGLTIDGKKVGIMQSPKFEPNKKIIAQNTYVCVMVV
jgi:hypothetical protein